MQRKHVLHGTDVLDALKIYNVLRGQILHIEWTWSFFTKKRGKRGTLVINLFLWLNISLELVHP